MKTKSKMMRKWAKKHGYKFKELKLAKCKPSDMRGFPTPKSWGLLKDMWDRPQFGPPGILLFDEFCDGAPGMGKSAAWDTPLWFWEV